MCKKLAEKLHLMFDLYKHTMKKGANLRDVNYASHSKAMAINHITIFYSRLLI